MSVVPFRSPQAFCATLFLGLISDDYMCRGTLIFGPFDDQESAKRWVDSLEEIALIYWNDENCAKRDFLPISPLRLRLPGFPAIFKSGRRFTLEDIDWDCVINPESISIDSFVAELPFRIADAVHRHMHDLFEETP
jgi:hypothetical protein